METGSMTKTQTKITQHWMPMNDLLRIPGLVQMYADLLEMAGIETLETLKQEEPVSLWITLSRVKFKKDPSCIDLPTLNQVEYWVRCADSLQPPVK